MRALIHTFAGVAALVTVFSLEPVARTGEIAILTYIALSFFAAVGAYAVSLVVVGVASGTPIVRWPHLMKQLFGGKRKQ